MKQGFTRRRRPRASPLTPGTSAALAPSASPVEAAGPDFPASESAEGASGELVGARRMPRTARPIGMQDEEALGLVDELMAHAIETAFYREPRSTPPKLDDRLAPLRLIQEFFHNPLPINPAQTPSSTSPEEAQQRLAELRYQLQVLAALQAVLTEELVALERSFSGDAAPPHA